MAAPGALHRCRLERRAPKTWRVSQALADVKQLRSLQQENLRLKKLLAERDLEIEVMKEITAKKW